MRDGHNLERAQMMVVGESAARLLHFIGLEADDEEVAKQGRELAKTKGGVFFFPRTRPRLMAMSETMDTAMSIPGAGPARVVQWYTNVLIDLLGAQ